LKVLSLGSIKALFEVLVWSLLNIEVIPLEMTSATLIGNFMLGKIDFILNNMKKRLT
jgi:hypothetical protein